MPLSIAPATLLRLFALGEAYLRHHPNMVALHNMLGGAYLQLKRTHQAKGYFETALKLQPKSASAAPIQISFLGYPGAMGAPFIDYLIADCIIIPAEQRAHYSESVITVPSSYQVNDDQRAIAERTPSRAELGLPEQGFVCCCFNNTFNRP